MIVLRCRRFSRKALERSAAGVLGVGLAVALGACSSSPAAGSSSSTTAAPSSGTGASVSSAASSKYGTILVDSSGRTLYMLSGDSSTASICTAPCAAVWPPLTTTGSPQAGTGVKASLLGTITRSDGSKQVTYGGHPLYTFSHDSAAGQVNGEGINNFGGTWYVLGTSGQPVTSASSSTSTTAAGGYGY